jgi:hypothetical protein
MLKKTAKPVGFFPVLHRFTRFSPVHLQPGFAGLTGPESLPVSDSTGRSDLDLTTLHIITSLFF